MIQHLIFLYPEATQIASKDSDLLQHIILKNPAQELGPSVLRMVYATHPGAIPIEDDKRFTLHSVRDFARRGLHQLDFAHVLRTLVFDQNYLLMQDHEGYTPLHRICDPVVVRSKIPDLVESVKRDACEYHHVVNDDVAAAKTHVHLFCQVAEKNLNCGKAFLEIMASTRNTKRELPLHLVLNDDVTHGL
jgi:hypothetical protein